MNRRLFLRNGALSFAAFTILPRNVLGGTNIVTPSDQIKLYKSDDHYEDFLGAMKSRKQPLSTVEVGHRTASLCHLINICYELNRPLQWDPAREEFLFFDMEANNLRKTPYREGFSLQL